MKLKWGVIGAGGIARRRTIPEGITKARNARLVAVMDVIPDIAEAVAAECPGRVAAYTDVDALLADGQVEAVYIASPAHLHLAQFRKCLKAGKHVLVEKPLAHTVRGAQAMARAAEGADVLCAEGYMMKFHPLHEKARRMILGGEIGKPVFARGQLSCWYPPMKGAWRQDPALGGGGSLVDMASHIYDLFQWMLESPIVEITALCDTTVHKYPVEDSATTLARFANGCHAVIDAFFNIPDDACLRVMEVYGSAGSILAEGTIGQGGGSMRACALGEVGGYDADQKRSASSGFREIKPGRYNMYRAEIEAFSQAVLDGEPVAINSIPDGVRIMELVAAAYRSAETGRRVKVD